MKKSGGDRSVYNKGPDLRGDGDDASGKTIFQLSSGRGGRNWPGQEKVGGGGKGELSKQRKQLEPGPEAARRW